MLVAAKCAANVVAQMCKVLSHPSKCIWICGRKCTGRGLHCTVHMLHMSTMCVGQTHKKGLEQ